MAFFIDLKNKDPDFFFLVCHYWNKTNWSKFSQGILDIILHELLNTSTDKYYWLRKVASYAITLTLTKNFDYDGLPLKSKARWRKAIVWVLSFQRINSLEMSKYTTVIIKWKHKNIHCIKYII